MKALFEAPVARAIMHRHGRETGLEILNRYAEGEVDARIEALAWDALDSRIERMHDQDADEIHVQCVFELASGPADGRKTYWDNQGIVACGASLPETTMAALQGRPLTDVVDHPFLKGLSVARVDNHDDDGTIALVADAADCLWDIARVEADAR